MSEVAPAGIATAVATTADSIAPVTVSAPTAVAEDPAAIATDAAFSSEHEKWKLTVDNVGKKKRMLGAFLEACRFLGVDGGTMTLAMDDLHRTVIEEKDNRALVMETVTLVFGRTLTLRCAPLDAKEPPRDADVKPMIENAIRWFEGDIIERQGRAAERTER